MALTRSALAAERRARVRRNMDSASRDSVFKKIIEGELEMVSDDSMISEPNCYGKHWIPGYVRIGETCPYCGWTKGRNGVY